MKKYPSKIDTWLIWLMVASLGIPLVLSVWERDWWVLFIMVITTLFVGNIFLYYKGRKFDDKKRSFN